MIEPNLKLQKPLEDYVEYMEKLGLRSILLLENMTDHAFSFQDPYHNAKGIMEAQELLAHRFDVFPSARYKVSDFMWGRRNSVAYIYWSFRYKPEKKIGRKTKDDLIMEGMSEIMFAPDGKLYSHSEFWGEHSHFDIKSYKKIFVKK